MNNAQKIDNRRTALITGASTGIGYELAIQCAKHGYDLIIIGHSERISEAKHALESMGVNVKALTADLSEPAEVAQVCDQVLSAGDEIEVLMLNAGAGLSGPFLATDLETELSIINLNVVAIVQMTKKLLPKLVERGQGKVLITSSIASLAPGPFHSVYHATKAFVQSFSEAIREELKDTGVSVTSLMPGATETQFFARAEMLDTKVGQGKKDDPAQVAKEGFDAMMRGEDHVIAGSWMNRVQGIVSKFSTAPQKARQIRTENEKIASTDERSEDAIAMLKNQHRECETLFERGEGTANGELSAIFKTLAEKLSDHMLIEEEVFYPAMATRFGSEINHAKEEHSEAKELIANIRSCILGSDLQREVFHELKEKIQQHIQYEESQVFADAKSIFSQQELTELGEEMRNLLVSEESMMNPGRFQKTPSQSRRQTHVQETH